MARPDKILRRYTSLSSVLDTLANRRIVLLSPSKWDDMNDIHFMELYRSSVGAASVQAICCTMSTETYHHWRVFTQGMDGVCVEFEREPLEMAVRNLSDIIARPVEYLKVTELEKLGRGAVERLPFIKRDGFSDEREWRIVSKSQSEVRQTFDISFELGWITRLVLNPWMPPSLAENLRSIIRGMAGCDSMKIEASRLTNSKRWKAAGDKLALSRTP